MCSSLYKPSIVSRPWLKQYIDFNTQKNWSQKFISKRLFQASEQFNFGETMENIRKKVDVKLVTSKEKLLKLASKPT